MIGYLYDRRMFSVLVCFFLFPSVFCLLSMTCASSFIDCWAIGLPVICRHYLLIYSQSIPQANGSFIIGHRSPRDEDCEGTLDPYNDEPLCRCFGVHFSSRVHCNIRSSSSGPARPTTVPLKVGGGAGAGRVRATLTLSSDPSALQSSPLLRGPSDPHSPKGMPQSTRVAFVDSMYGSCYLMTRSSETSFYGLAW